MAKLDLQNRSPRVEVLPDQRLRVTRVYDIIDFVAKKSAQFLADIELPWGTADVTYPQCLLVKQDVPGQNDDPAKSPNDPPPQLIRVYEQIDPSLETSVGKTDVSFDQYGRQTVVNTFLQFSTGTPVYQVVGTTAAPAPFASCILKTEERTNDGTLMRIKRTYIDAGELADTEELKFGGKLLLRHLRYLNQVPPTPSGWHLVTQSTEYIAGLPVYDYGFASANGSIGLGGEIDRNVQYEISPDQGTTGITRTTITYLTDQAVNSNPITGPGGSVLISIDKKDQDGYRMWVGEYVSGQGVVASSTDYRNEGKLVIYSLTVINAVPTTPSPTIGGTVVLFDKSVRNGARIENGTLVYDYKYAEANGLVSISTRGEADGSLLYTVVQIDNTSNTAPAYPGGGTAYCTSLDHMAESGFYRHVAVWHKLPSSVAIRQQVQWEKPGIISFVGSPPQFVSQSPISLTLLATRTVDYDVTQITTAPYSAAFYASFTETYTPTDTGIAVTHSKAWGGYLGGASSISGTASPYNGIMCTVWEAKIISSSPSALPTGTQTIHVHNDIYLTDIAGTVVYRRSVTTIVVP